MQLPRRCVRALALALALALLAPFAPPAHAAVAPPRQSLLPRTAVRARQVARHLRLRALLRLNDEGLAYDTCMPSLPCARGLSCRLMRDHAAACDKPAAACVCVPSDPAARHCASSASCPRGERCVSPPTHAPTQRRHCASCFAWDINLLEYTPVDVHPASCLTGPVYAGGYAGDACGDAAPALAPCKGRRVCVHDVVEKHRQPACKPGQRDCVCRDPGHHGRLAKCKNSRDCPTGERCVSGTTGSECAGCRAAAVDTLLYEPRDADDRRCVVESDAEVGEAETPTSTARGTQAVTTTQVAAETQAAATQATTTTEEVATTTEAEAEATTTTMETTDATTSTEAPEATTTTETPEATTTTEAPEATATTKAPETTSTTEVAEATTTTEAPEASTTTEAPVATTTMAVVSAETSTAATTTYASTTYASTTYASTTYASTTYASTDADEMNSTTTTQAAATTMEVALDGDTGDEVGTSYSAMATTIEPATTATTVTSAGDESSADAYVVSMTDTTDATATTMKPTTDAVATETAATATLVTADSGAEESGTTFTAAVRTTTTTAAEVTTATVAEWTTTTESEATTTTAEPATVAEDTRSETTTVTAAEDRDETTTSTTTTTVAAGSGAQAVSTEKSDGTSSEESTEASDGSAGGRVESTETEESPSPSPTPSSSPASETGTTTVDEGGSASATSGSSSCIAAHHLRAHAAHELVFATHRLASVLCDARGSCATPGHVVAFRGRGMTMRGYCANHAAGGCAARDAVAVNSPVWRRRDGAGPRVRSETPGLQFTALAARWETRVEERVLAALVDWVGA